jgi:hypothetical protein
MMKTILIAALLVLLVSLPVRGQLYEWTDESGSVNFTDNPDTVPPKYHQKVKIREGTESGVAKGEVTPVVKSPETPSPAPRAEKLYDGRPISWWQTQHTALTARLSALQAELTSLKEEQNAARRRKAMHQSGVNRRALAAKVEEAAAKEAQIAEAQKVLAQFRETADNAGLSVDMLEGGGR